MRWSTEREATFVHSPFWISTTDRSPPTVMSSPCTVCHKVFAVDAAFPHARARASPRHFETAERRCQFFLGVARAVQAVLQQPALVFVHLPGSLLATVRQLLFFVMERRSTLLARQPVPQPFLHADPWRWRRRRIQLWPRVRLVMIFLRHELFWICLVQVSTTHHLSSCHVLATEQYPRYLPPLRIWVLLMVLFLTLMEWAVGPQVQWRKNRCHAYQKICTVRGTFRSVGFDSYARTGIQKIRKQYPVTHTVSGIYHKQHFKH